MSERMEWTAEMCPEDKTWRIIWNGFEPIAHCGSGLGATAEMIERRAKLMASAPDLLAACTALLASIREMRDEGCCVGLDASDVPHVADHLEAAEELANAAIAKATNAEGGR